jgi:hypothetical protein
MLVNGLVKAALTLEEQCLGIKSLKLSPVVSLSASSLLILSADGTNQMLYSTTATL